MNSINEFFEANRQKLLNILPDKSVALLFAATLKTRSWDSHYPFCQDKNFYYLTGYKNHSSAVLIKKIGSAVSTVLFVVKQTPSQIHWSGYLPTIEEASTITGIQTVKPLDTLNTHLTASLKYADHLYLDFHPINPNEPLTPELQFADMMRLRHPHITIHPIHNLMAQLREIKSSEEVARISSAIELTHKGIEQVLRYIRPGVPEYELEAHFNFELHRSGTNPAFSGIIASGKNATVLHYNAMKDVLKPDELILLDLGAEYKHYSADISRTFPINGKFSSKQRDIYSVVLEANNKTIEAVTPGIALIDLNKITQKALAEGLKTLGLIDDLSDISKFYTHGVSHSLGLDTHDIVSGIYEDLRPGMVITIEPGLYFPDDGLGVRIEDDILVTESGYRNLSIDIPKEITSIENWMSSLHS
ncbi:MAG: aminopeptidase P family protein [bacterium]